MFIAQGVTLAGGRYVWKSNKKGPKEGPFYNSIK